MWCVCMGGQLGEDPEYPGILSIPDTGYVVCMYGGTTREHPKYPGILSIPDTGYVACMYGGTTWGGS